MALPPITFFAKWTAHPHYTQGLISITDYAQPRDRLPSRGGLYIVVGSRNILFYPLNSYPTALYPIVVNEYSKEIAIFHIYRNPANAGFGDI